MNNLHLFVPYHRPDVLAKVPNRPWITRVLLGDLKIDPPEFQDNRLGEGRLFLSSLEHPPEAEWVGVLNARCPDKYKDFDWDEVPKRLGDVLSYPDDVAAPWPTKNGWSDDWLAYSEREHQGMTELLAKEFPVRRLNHVRNRPSLWGNDFVCHAKTWVGWRTFWRSSVEFFHGVYGFAMPFACEAKYDCRKPALLYERVTTLFFALDDYTIHPISGGIRT